MSGMKSIQAARGELSRIRSEADARVRHSMEKVFSEFVGATDRELRRAMHAATAPIRAEEDAAIARMAAELEPRERKQLFAETLDPHLMNSWQR
jgi:hypothetical protein